MKGKVIIVEDQFIEANNLQMILERSGFTVCGIARSVPAAITLLDKYQPELVLLDIYLQGTLTGIDLAHTLNERGIAFVYLSANSNEKTLGMAKATHPYGFLVKPFREKDVLIMLEIARHLHEHGIAAVIKKQPAAVDAAASKAGNFYGIVGRSTALKTVLEYVQLVAPADTSVLITGESGTGKEGIADCIHQLSSRSTRPFVKINCAALPATLIESILFGHEKGAFTGATERHIGKFEQAHTGTIFLDEIGELSQDVQVKLLRILQEREIERLGGRDTIKTDVRVIAATNRNLEKEVAGGRFRLDLYYRLNVFPIALPPLRDRKDDIPLLANHFIERYCQRVGKPPLKIAETAMEDLLQHSWAGNIRELENVIERAVLLTREGPIKRFLLGSLDNPLQGNAPVKTMEENERDHIVAVLKQCGGKIFGKGGAAEVLGIHASTLNSRIKKLGINKSKLLFR